MPREARDDDEVLCDCGLEPLKALVERIEGRHEVVVTRAPALCLTLLRAEDSLERQEFYLGEALTSACEVTVDGATGHGLCLGDDPVRAYCLAVCDALLQGAGAPPEVAAFLDAERAALEARDTEEFNHTLRTQVDFKLMEQE